MRTINKTTITTALLSLALLVPSAAHAQSTHGNVGASRFMLSNWQTGGPLKLKKIKHYGDGSTSFSYEVFDMDDYPGGWIYYIVNANNPSDAAALATAASYRSFEKKPQRGGQMSNFWADTAAYHGHQVYVSIEIADDFCRISTTFSYHRVAVDFEIADVNGEECGNWMANDYGRPLTNALLSRIP